MLLYLEMPLYCYNWDLANVVNWVNWVVKIFRFSSRVLNGVVGCKKIYNKEWILKSIFHFFFILFWENFKIEAISKVTVKGICAAHSYIQLKEKSCLLKIIQW